jgi:hypothetical protein
MAHPQVLMATAQLAQKAVGYKDRELFFRLTGSLPDKKGASINIFAGSSANTEVKSPLDITPRSRLRSFDDEIIEMSKELEPAGPPFIVKEESDEQGMDE